MWQFLCAFLVGTTGGLVADNRFEAAGALSSGVHIQRSGPFDPNPIPTDGTRVVRNTLVETQPLGTPVFGAIRARDGTGVVISDNVVIGPWQAGLALTNLQDSEIERNSIQNPVNFGILTSSLSGPPEAPLFLRDNVFRNNQLTGAGTTGEPLPFGFAGGVFLRRACGNVFLGNDLHGNLDDLGAVFGAQTGANTLAGNSTIVVDNGSFDCDGDGVSDPNVITGSGQVLADASFGGTISEAAFSTGGAEPQIQ